jgi:hypothetical protein
MLNAPMSDFLEMTCAVVADIKLLSVADEARALSLDNLKPQAS